MKLTDFPSPPTTKPAALGLLVAAACWLISAMPGAAFPPAPNYTIYGMVRDQVGQTVTADGAEVLLLKGGVVIGRAPISSSRLEQNYELKVRIDQNAPGTIFYSEKAVAANGLFSLVVEMNGLLFYPIEVSGNLTAGRGGERVRLDLTLGDDTDKDSLPDIWEMWQLYQAGLFPDANGKWDLSLINRAGDWDKDGVSDYLEYLAGTFAGDATSTFAMEIKQKLPASVRFEFFAVTGKSYVIESSLDMKAWTRVRFAVGAPAIGYEAHQATASGTFSPPP